MDGLEGPLMITAMVLIFGVIFAKAMATQMIARMDRQINEVAHGAVVGSALIKEIEAGEDVLLKLRGYVENLKGKND